MWSYIGWSTSLAFKILMITSVSPSKIVSKMLMSLAEILVFLMANASTTSLEYGSKILWERTPITLPVNC